VGDNYQLKLKKRVVKLFAMRQQRGHLLVNAALAILLFLTNGICASPRSSQRLRRLSSAKAGKEHLHAGFVHNSNSTSQGSYDGGYIYNDEQATIHEDATASNRKCNMSTLQHETALRQLILTITPQDVLDTITSPQSKAFHWLVYEDAIVPPLCPPSLDDIHVDGGYARAVMLLERYAMIAFYYATNGDDWKECSASTINNLCTRTITAQSSEVLSFVIEQAFGDDTSTTQHGRKIGTESWLSDTPTCDWGGVGCSYTTDGNNNQGYYTIDQIEFEDNNLVGTLLPELSTLHNLKFLILEKGHLFGPIPSSYGSLSNLRVLDMDYNQLTGNLSIELYDLVELRELDLNDNQLSGTIGTEIGRLSELVYLQVDNNAFEGNIPVEFGGLNELVWAVFHGNNFTGEMPLSVCENRNETSNQKITILTADCLEDGPVVCSCCDYCGEPL